MNRFTDTSIWMKPWFRKLTPAEKMAFCYIKDNCDCAGVWDADTELAEFCIGEKIEWASLAQKTNGNIEVLSNKKWWLIDFCTFQYGELTEKCPPHRKVIATLLKHGLLERVKEGYEKGCQTLQEEEEEEEEEKEEEEEEEVKRKPTPKVLFNAQTHKWENVTEEMLELWERAYPACDMERELTKMATWLLANPTKTKTNYKRFITNWLSRTQDKGGTR